MMGKLVRDPSCDFCDIAAGEKPDTELVWRTADWVAFFPVEPATPGHTLIIPTGHVTGLWEADRDVARTMMDAALDIGQAVRSALAPEGLNLITSSGKAAEQSVFHLHMHVVPRWHDDNFGNIWPEWETGSESNLTSRAKLIANAYASQEENI